jgi:iron complex transport system ATP-binding protein
MTAAVAMTAATVRIGGRPILGPLDLVVGNGEQWVLLGPNGGGKTTALSLMGARRQSSSGEVRVLGERLGRTDVRALRRRIGHVSHRLAEEMPGRRTVVETVLTGRDGVLVPWGRTFGESARAEATALLETVGCGLLAGRPLATCSLGERQRVLIARALYGEHELLLFDEPAAGLDLPARELLLDAMAAAAVARTTVLATHHLEEIPPTATHAGLLRGGELVASGPIEEVLADEPMSACFGLPLTVQRHAGRWTTSRASHVRD